ncbi:MAG TPA: DUF1127 domain-containing protein [Vineibacter sp.]|nr:DUF1127 domain-containing protein [Vineibacter sp.]
MHPTRQQTLRWTLAQGVVAGGPTRLEWDVRAAASAGSRATSPATTWWRALRARLDYAVVQTWIDRSRQRSALRELSDRQLDDIGVTRADARREAAKPFWSL